MKGSFCPGDFVWAAMGGSLLPGCGGEWEAVRFVVGKI